MPDNTNYIGQPISRLDGPAKVTGEARYAADYQASGMAHGRVVGSGIARGRIVSIDTVSARAVAGVIRIFSHLDRPRTAWFTSNYIDDAAPPGVPMRPFYDDRVHYSGQPVALVIAENYDTARHAASLIRVEYAAEPHATDLDALRDKAYVPPKSRDGIPPPPKPRGDADAALAAATTRVSAEYRIAAEHHNPMEPHATTVLWHDDGGITVHDKTQGVQNTQRYIHKVFGIPAKRVRVVAPFVGGAFGASLRPQYQVFLAVMAASVLQRSVQLVLTREQMFTHVWRPETINQVWLGADRSGALQALKHNAIALTSQHEDHQEAVVNWSGMLYRCDNVTLGYRLAKADTHSPGDMRAPGAPLGVFALESAMDELAEALAMDPVALRLRNYAETDAGTGKPHTSKALREAYAEGAARIGWSRRPQHPGAWREGRELIGLGMATGIWEANFRKSTARAVLGSDGLLEVSTATSDIGTGTTTILAQIAAETMGVAIDDVTVRIADSDLPESMLQGGSWTAASSGAAVEAACRAVRDQVFHLARSAEGSPLANIDVARAVFANGMVSAQGEPDRCVAIADAMRAGGLPSLEAEETVSPSLLTQASHVSNTHSAVFAEVAVDAELGIVRLTRIVVAVAAGRILNEKTARSQIIGGVVFGIGMALHEQSETDHALARIMNRSLAEYHLPAHADMPEIDVIFVDEPDNLTSPLGVKGLGEIGIVGTAAAIANAIHNASGKRIRALPITIDRMLAA